MRSTPSDDVKFPMTVKIRTLSACSNDTPHNVWLDAILADVEWGGKWGNSSNTAASSDDRFVTLQNYAS
jgi:hypothetical protein